MSKKKKKSLKKNYGPYQLIVKILFCATMAETWDCIKSAPRSNKRPVGKYVVTCNDVLPIYIFLYDTEEVGSIIYKMAELGMVPDNNKMSDLTRDVIEILEPYIPFIKTCANKMANGEELPVSEIKRIFEDMGLTLCSE